MNPFFPEEEYPDTYEIPFEKLYEMGIRGIIFDIDNASGKCTAATSYELR